MTPQALTGSALPNLIALLSADKIDRLYWSKLPALLVWSILLSPLYFLEKITFLFIRKPPIHPEPIFIIGHWRSGTTYLHYLLAKDNQFGYCSNVDAFVPGALFIGRWLSRKVIAWRLPKTRPMDEVKLDTDAPQEDEFAMMLLTSFSFYHGFVFPRSLKKSFFSYAVFDPANVKLIYDWSLCYYQYIRKLSYRYNGRRLLLKNPVNTARVKYLTSMFPKAKFIYLQRDPAAARKSTLRMFQAMMHVNSLQSFDEAQLTKCIDLFHGALIKEYETQRESIGHENLFEVNYDELIAAPLLTVKRIYDTLNLSGFEENQLAFEKFIEEQKDYKPHQYSYNPA